MNARIREVLTELSELAVDQRRADLIAELATLLGNDQPAEIRKTLANLRRSIQRRDHTMQAKLHTLSNHIMGLEERISELADFVLPISHDSRERIVNGAFGNEQHE